MVHSINLLELELTRDSTGLAESSFDGLSEFVEHLKCPAEIPGFRYCDVLVSLLAFHAVRTMSFPQVFHKSHSRYLRMRVRTLCLLLCCRTRIIIVN